MQRRNLIRIAGGGTILAATFGSALLAGCGSGMPGEAVQAWQGPGPDVGADPDPRRWLLSYAILAPHSHNLQSWIVDLSRPGDILLFCDLTRLLPETDPLSRQIMMSQGTFLELLDLAARERGIGAEITLFPEGVFGADKPDARPVARIRLRPDTTLQKDPLFAQILQRHTHRGPYDAAKPVPEAAWRAISASVAGSGVVVGGVGPAQSQGLERHRKIASEAWRIELSTPRTIMESYKVLRVGSREIAQHRDGLTVTDPMPVALAALGLFDRSRAPAPDDYATTSQLKTFDHNLQTTPAFLWMNSAGNDRATQVQAGRAYARVQLAATAQGLSMQPLSQALQEYPEQKETYRAIHELASATSAGQTVQMWARLGFAAPVGPSPRRPLKDFIRS